MGEKRIRLLKAKQKRKKRLKEQKRLLF
ncbi:hypothetical protein CLS_09040 [[Clostridium] cf. saccharolyticum K10]|nr:hypothetical protein CLS_09040 [[Clostridium] cf. saccharolyticum K10]